MVYSVWNPVAKVYNYFATPADKSDLETPPKPSVRGQTDIGCCVDDITWSLPASAKPMGSGPLAKGMIARDGSAAGALGDIVSGVLSSSFVVGAAIGVIAYKLWFKK